MAELHGVNLNLLLSLDALLAEGSVTQAAKRAGLSQSAMSHNLANLRELFADPLLVRTSNGMQPTARAEALRLPLRAALNDLSLLLGPDAATDPSALCGRVTLATADFVAAHLAAGLVTLLAQAAPGLDLSVRAWSAKTLATALQSGDVQLAIGPKPAEQPGLASEPIASEPWACAVRYDHPALAGDMDLAAFVALEHVMVSPTGRGESAVDAALAQRGLSRRVRCRVASFLGAPPIVARTDLLLTAPRSLFSGPAVASLRVFDVPFPLAPLTLHATWHQRFEQSSQHRFLLGAVRQVIDRHGVDSVDSAPEDPVVDS